MPAWSDGHPIPAQNAYRNADRCKFCNTKCNAGGTRSWVSLVPLHLDSRTRSIHVAHADSPVGFDIAARRHARCSIRSASIDALNHWRRIMANQEHQHSERKERSEHHEKERNEKQENRNEKRSENRQEEQRRNEKK